VYEKRTNGLVSNYSPFQGGKDNRSHRRLMLRLGRLELWCSLFHVFFSIEQLVIVVNGGRVDKYLGATRTMKHEEVYKVLSLCAKT
jgi:hypothetical protein